MSSADLGLKIIQFLEEFTHPKGRRPWAEERWTNQSGDLIKILAYSIGKSVIFEVMECSIYAGKMAVAIDYYLTTTGAKSDLGLP